jgi:hypothetical protein
MVRDMLNTTRAEIFRDGLAVGLRFSESQTRRCLFIKVPRPYDAIETVGGGTVRPGEPTLILIRPGAAPSRRAQPKRDDLSFPLPFIPRSLTGLLSSSANSHRFWSATDVTIGLGPKHLLAGMTVIGLVRSIDCGIGGRR